MVSSQCEAHVAAARTRKSAFKTPTSSRVPSGFDTLSRTPPAPLRRRTLKLTEQSLEAKVLCCAATWTVLVGVNAAMSK